MLDFFFCLPRTDIRDFAVTPSKKKTVYCAEETLKFWCECLRWFGFYFDSVSLNPKLFHPVHGSSAEPSVVEELG